MTMKVLLVKTSSMGDLIHTLPALTDAKRYIPSIQFDWLVEEAFTEIPRWHSSVSKIIPVALRRWRHDLFSANTRSEWRAWRENLATESYDLILDAQGLIKSALYSYFANGPRAGLDKYSASDALISHSYHHKYAIDTSQHAVKRMRNLFSQALGYPLPETPPDFGLNRYDFQDGGSQHPYLVFLHGTSWNSKLWPEEYWIELANLVAQAGYQIKISGLSITEITRANHIALSSNATIDVITEPGIMLMTKVLANAQGVISVDTGLGQIAAALGLPTLSLYGSTDVSYTGAIGLHVENLTVDFPCSPCFKKDCVYQGKPSMRPVCLDHLKPKKVWERMQSMLMG